MTPRNITSLIVSDIGIGDATGTGSTRGLGVRSQCTTSIKTALSKIIAIARAQDPDLSVRIGPTRGGRPVPWFIQWFNHFGP
jgi:hypothetical protein